MGRMKKTLAAAICLALSAASFASEKDMELSEIQSQMLEMSSIEAENIEKFDVCIVYSESKEDLNRCLREKEENERAALERFVSESTERIRRPSKPGRCKIPTLKGAVSSKFRRNPKADSLKPRPDAIKSKNFISYGAADA